MLERSASPDEQFPGKSGQPVYDASGNQLGRIQGVTERGFEVDVRATTDLGPEQDPGQGIGEGYLVWRYDNCGEMGSLQQIPDTCPNRGVGREHLYASIED